MSEVRAWPLYAEFAFANVRILVNVETDTKRSSLCHS
jgi:hypothetical protein